MKDARQQINQRLSALKTERSSWISHWQELNDYLLPWSGRFFTTDKNQGAKKNTRIIDTTATFALNALSSGMMAGITNPARPWFALRVPDPELSNWAPAKRWLDDVRDRMAEMFIRSNLYTVLPLVYSDLGVFGTSAFAVLEDDEDLLRCYPYPVGSYCLGTSFRGKVDSVYREFMMTAGQIIQQFGEETVSSQVRQSAKNSQKDQWFEVIHAIEPNPEADSSRIGSKFKKYRSIYMEKANSDGFLKESGFDEFPVMAPRWRVTGEDIYGHGPGMDCLGDVKALQLEQKRKIQAIEKGINPPLTAPSALRNGVVSTLPGAITWQDVNQGQRGLSPIYELQPAWLQYLIQDIQECQGRIRKAFFEDLFLMIANDQRSNVTAMEISARQEEKMLMLGPVLTRMNDEMLDPLINRTFAIMLRSGKLPPPPEELQGQDITVEYISSMAQAMKMLGITGLERLTQYAGGLAGMAPDVLDSFNADAALQKYGSMLGVPGEVLRDKDEVSAIRAQRQKQTQMAQMLQASQQGADIAQTLSQAQMTDPSALSAMTQAMQGGGLAGVLTGGAQ